MSSRIIRGKSATVFHSAFSPAGDSNPFGAFLTNGPAGTDDKPVSSESQVTEALVSEAFEQGRREGWRRAAEENAAAAAALTQQVATTAAHLCSERSRLRREAESDVVRLALAIAKRVIHRELSADPQAIQGLVHVAIERLNAKDLIRVRTHPSHLEAVRQALEKSRPPAQAELTADAALSIGDLIFETAHGELDASIDSQMKEIELGIADRLGR